jgi:3-oxochol-4-en-24-oyl-CoA dehydrogenase
VPIGVSEDHLALHAAVAGWCERHCPPAVPRALLDAERQSLPPFWSELSAQGWLGLHLPEEHGGSGYGLPELVVVLEELGRVVAPGPTLPTVLAGALVQRGGDEALAKSLLPALATGERVGAVALDAAPALTGAERADGLHVRGTVRPVLAGHLADLLLAPVRVADRLEWCALDVPADQRRELPSVDRTRRVAEVAVDAVVPADRRLPGLDVDTARDVAAVLVAAEAVGVAQWCVTTAAEHAATRVQFGRPIGQFQGVKHRCADMLGRLELARAATWDAARATADAAASLTASSALALALDAAFANAKDCIQVLGGVGFTWEHDAHVYLRRALSLRSLLGPEDAWRTRAAAAARDGARRVLAVDLGEDADRWRAELRAFLASVQDLAADEQRRAVADAGYIMPTWPKPWGRDAKAAE